MEGGGGREVMEGGGGTGTQERGHSWHSKVVTHVHKSDQTPGYSG